MRSILVNSLMLCAFMSGGADSLCAAPVAAAVSQQATSMEAPGRPPFQANDRLRIGTPSHDLLLAEENEIPLEISTLGLKTLLLEQMQSPDVRSQDPPPPVILRDGYAQPKILRHDDGSLYVKVAPVRLEKVLLRFTALYEDRAWATSEITVNVVPSDRPADRIIVTAGSPDRNIGSFTVPLKPESHREGLFIEAVYPGFDHPLLIYQNFVRFEVRTEGRAPIIKLDKATGSIEPLEPGQALVVTRFAGKTNFTCVRVVEEIDPGFAGPKSQCETLLRAGEKLATR